MESNKVDDRISCPYNSTHLVKPDRFVWHLVKCESKDSAQVTTARCPFDTTHVLPIEEIIEHVKNECTSKPNSQIVERLQKGYDDWARLVEGKKNGKHTERNGKKKFNHPRNGKPKKSFRKAEETQADNSLPATQEETKSGAAHENNSNSKAKRSKSVKTYRKVADTDASQQRGRPGEVKPRQENKAASQERQINIVSESLPDMG